MLAVFICFVLTGNIVFATSDASKTNLQNRKSEILSLEDGTQVTIHEPPANWNPLIATDEELSYYFYPERPKDAKDYEEWEKM